MVTIPDTDLECQWRILGLGLTHMSRLGIVAGSKRPTPALEFAWTLQALGKCSPRRAIDHARGAMPTRRRSPIVQK